MLFVLLHAVSAGLFPLISLIIHCDWQEEYEGLKQELAVLKKKHKEVLLKECEDLTKSCARLQREKEHIKTSTCQKFQALSFLHA